MDISHSLGKLLARFFRARISDLRVYVHSPDRDSLEHWIVTAYFNYDGKPRSAGAVDLSKHKALVKTLVEAGESILAYQEGRSVRCGIAGGLFRSTAMDRAKSEALERDAFLFHYREGIPFAKLSEPGHEAVLSRFGANLRPYVMATRDPQKCAIFLTDSDGARGLDKCLFFGASCSGSASDSLSKALSEYAGIFFNHRNGDSECRKEFGKETTFGNSLKAHHYSSLDERNRYRFENLCSSEIELPLRSPIDPNKWLIKDLESPVRGFRYVHIRHPDLVELEFGVPETWASPGKPLFHPYY